MKRFVKYLYAAMVVIAACYICSKWIPSMELAKKIEIYDEIDVEQSCLDVGPGMVLRQAFVTQHKEIDNLKVYLDSFLLDKQFRKLIASVIDEEGNVLYMKSIPGISLKSYGWQEVVSDLMLEQDEVYYLELRHEASTEGNLGVAITENGRTCFEMTYRQALGQEEYAPYYWFVILATAIVLARIFRKYK